jgi:hypothetical protein
VRIREQQAKAAGSQSLSGSVEKQASRYWSRLEAAAESPRNSQSFLLVTPSKGSNQSINKSINHRIKSSSEHSYISILSHNHTHQNRTANLQSVDHVVSSTSNSFLATQIPTSINHSVETRQ